MPTLDTLPLQGKKNLLAFSAGVDSSALFFLLLEEEIPFDIAIVDYGIREESKAEVAHAMQLAQHYHKTCYHTQAPQFTTHFEANARTFRYHFFEQIITTHHYDILLTAHQLNDQLEWLLMRLSKGAGLSELLGLERITQQKNYTLFRPLLEYSKEELLHYLKENNYPYFIDKSNLDSTYERNRFRHAFSDPLLAEFKEGIKRSFCYLKADKKRVESTFETLFEKEALHIIWLKEKSAKVKATDLALKKEGYLLSASQRREIEKEESLVIGGKWAIVRENHLLYIAPYVTQPMPKKFKELCRCYQIPKKIRPYLYQTEIEIKQLSALKEITPSHGEAFV